MVEIIVSYFAALNSGARKGRPHPHGLGIMTAPPYDGFAVFLQGDF